MGSYSTEFSFANEKFWISVAQQSNEYAAVTESSTLKNDWNSNFYFGKF